MDIKNNVPDLRALVQSWKKAGQSVALVPTMGALHSGHLTLIKEAKKRADRVVASIFVNPLQFGANEDLSRYPRQEEQDAKLLEETGCDLLFLPSVEAVYPKGFATTVSVSGLDLPMEGASRPGHFNGVATVVSKLFMMVQPDVALFGEKDWQQLAIIRQFVRDLDMPIEIVGVPTVREDDGLARSSRNAYLSESERQIAPILARTLKDAIAHMQQGTAVDQALNQATASLESAGFKVDYLLLSDGVTLEPLSQLTSTARIFVAARLGSTRLIDNMAAA